MATTNGALQFGQGAKQAVKGDSWNAAGNMVFDALGMASLGVPRVTAGGANTAVRPATVASDEVVLAPYQQTGRNLADDARPALVDTARVGDGVKATGGAAGKVDDVVATSSKPEWLQRLDAGNQFNKVQSKNHPYNEVYIQRPDGNGYYRVDSYNPIKGEIVSRKLTQLSEISEATAKGYINEAITKYPSGATIAKVPSSGSLGAQKLQGTVILEIPPQNGEIPQNILDSANKVGVLTRDTNGKIY